jgi:ketosteroid isomerase-like protein
MTTTPEQVNVQAVRQIFEAFGSGDIPYILDQLDDNVRWSCNSDAIIPWGGDFSGKAKVPQFFSAIDGSVDVLGFEPKEFIAEGDQVVTLGTFTCRSKETGKAGELKWVFIWKLAGAKVLSYEQFHDSGISDIFRA